MSSKNFSVRMAFASDNVLPPVKRLYVPFAAMITAHFNNFWGQAIFLLTIYRLSEKMCTFAHLIYCFVVKTKITIWAESICGISP